MSAKSDQAKGKIKEAAGVLTGDEQLEKEGKRDQLAGDAKELVDDVTDKAKAVIDDVKKAVKKD